MSAATVDGLAPISMPLPNTVSAASGYKSVSASSHNRFSAFAEGANIAEPSPWRREAGTLVPIEEFIRDPSKRQIRRIKEYMKKTSVNVGMQERLSMHRRASRRVSRVAKSWS